MARKSKKTDKKTADYNEWLGLHTFGNTKENKTDFDMMDKVRTKFGQAKRARQNACYWFSYTDLSTGTNAGTGGDWNDWWEIQEKAWAEWHNAFNSDDFRANVKAPLITGRIESMMDKVAQLNMRWDAKPSTEEDRGKEKVSKALLDWWFSRSGAKNALHTWVKDALIHGSGFARVYYQVAQREYKFPDIEKMKEEAKESKEEGKEQEDDVEIKWKKSEKTTIYKDIVLEPKPIQSLFFDPSARNLHGRFHSAHWVVERRIMSLEAFKAEYENDPNAHNVDKVKPGVWYDDADYSFFAVPNDILEEDMVEVLEYENDIDDEYAVIANDLCIKSSPLPWNHKQLSYHKIDVTEFVHQFYHVGVGDFLMNIQGTQEILSNMIIDYIFQSMNQKYLVAATSFGEFTESFIREESQFIPMNDSDDRPIQSKVMALPHAPVNFDAFRMFDILGQQATLASQMDPTQVASIPPNAPATLGVIAQRQADAKLNGVIDRFANTGWLSAGRQIWALMQQKYSVPEVKEIVGEDGKKKYEEKWKSIRLDGFKIVEDEKMGIDIEETPDGFSFFEVKDKFIDTVSEMDLRIAPDSLEIMNRGLEMQRARELYAQMMPNAVDPDNTQMMRAMEQSGRIPLYDVYELSRWFAETNSAPSDVLITEDRKDELEYKEAVENANKMLEGENVPGVPGRSKAYIRAIGQVLRGINGNIQKLDELIKESQGQLPVQWDPATGQPLPPPVDPQSQDLMDRLIKTQTQLGRHLTASMMPEDMFDEEVLETAANVAQMVNPPPPPAPPMGMPGMMPPNGVPMPPGAPQMGGMGAGVPMPGQPTNVDVQGQLPVNPAAVM